LTEWKTIVDGLIKNNASFEEFKAKIKILSAYTSVAPSPISSPGQTENDDTKEEISKHE
jgi:hypothetical protein